jgi:ATP-binding protein involved in chromosome partitioning
MITEEQIKEALKQVHDPEIGISLVDLNMIKTIRITEDEILIEMVFTMPGCPMYVYMMEEVKKTIEPLAEGRKVSVRKLDEKWIPPWETAKE